MSVSPSRSWLQLLVCAPAPVSRLPDSASGPCFAVPHSSWSHRLPPPTPQWISPLCSLASQVLAMSLTSCAPSASATASGLPDAALGTVSPGRNEDLPVPAQEMYVHAQGLKTTQGGQGPRGDGPVPVAFCMPRRHRHPGLHCFRRSIPRLYAPLSTLRVLPHGSDPRMTRGQCGSLLLHCNGLSPSISCRSSRRTVAQSHTPRNHCVRFAVTVASDHATLVTKRTLRLTWAGLSPAGSHQLAAGALILSPRRREQAAWEARRNRVLSLF